MCEGKVAIVPGAGSGIGAATARLVADRRARGRDSCELPMGRTTAKSRLRSGVARQMVRNWRERFAKYRLDGLDDEPRCGEPRKIGDDQTRRLSPGRSE